MGTPAAETHHLQMPHVRPDPDESQPSAAAADEEDSCRAEEVAWRAFDDWKDASTGERARMLRGIADLVDANTISSKRLRLRRAGSRPTPPVSQGGTR